MNITRPGFVALAVGFASLVACTAEPADGPPPAADQEISPESSPVATGLGLGTPRPKPTSGVTCTFDPVTSTCAYCFPIHRDDRVCQLTTSDFCGCHKQCGETPSPCN